MEDEIFCINCEEPDEMLLEGFCEDCFLEFISWLVDLEDVINKMRAEMG